MCKKTKNKINKLEEQLETLLFLAERFKEDDDMDNFNEIMDEDIMPLYCEIRLLETSQ